MNIRQAAGNLHPFIHVRGIGRKRDELERRKGEAHQEQGRKHDPWREALDDIGPWGRSALFGGVASLAGSVYPSIYAHELGHKVAIEALYNNAHPVIEVTPFKGGVTRWTPSGGLTELGKRLGQEASRGVVSAAGTLVDMTSAATSFAVGYKLRKKHPVAGAALMGYAGYTVLNSISYAVTALGPEGIPTLAARGNDFAGMALNLGIHPLVSIGLMAALLPAEYWILHSFEKNADTGR